MVVLSGSRFVVVLVFPHHCTFDRGEAVAEELVRVRSLFYAVAFVHSVEQQDE